MGQLIVSEQMTLDGVIDNSDQWFAADDDHNVGSDAQLRVADAMLLDRVTFEGLSQMWPTMTDDRGFADRVNAMPKYVVSRTLAEPLGWNGRLLAPDLLSQVAAL
jgi:dihydrofolate reductase